MNRRSVYAYSFSIRLSSGLTSAVNCILRIASRNMLHNEFFLTPTHICISIASRHSLPQFQLNSNSFFPPPSEIFHSLIPIYADKCLSENFANILTRELNNQLIISIISLLNFKIIFNRDFQNRWKIFVEKLLKNRIIWNCYRTFPIVRSYISRNSRFCERLSHPCIVKVPTDNEIGEKSLVSGANYG